MSRALMVFCLPTHSPLDQGHVEKCLHVTYRLGSLVVKVPL